MGTTPAILAMVILAAAALVYIAVVLNALSAVSRRKGRDGKEGRKDRYGNAYYGGYHRRRYGRSRRSNRAYGG